jgi:hypothetical protein
MSMAKHRFILSYGLRFLRIVLTPSENGYVKEVTEET